MEASYAISLMLPLRLLLSLFLTKPKTHSGGYDSRWYGDVLVLAGPKPAPNSKSSCNSKYQWSAKLCLPKQPQPTEEINSSQRISQFCRNSLPDRFTQVWRSSPFPHYLTSQAALNGRMNSGAAYSTQYSTRNHMLLDLIVL